MIDQGGVELFIEQTETLEKRLDGLGYLSRGIEKNPEILDRSRRCQAAIENPKKRFFKEEKQHGIKANKRDSKLNNKESC